MGALTIFIIRHAEKPADPDSPWPGPGFRVDGCKDEKSLVIRGWQRAGAWAALFGTEATGRQDYPRPAVIYAADPTHAGRQHVSRRPWETVVPLAEKLGCPLLTTFAVGQERELVSTLVELESVTLVSWEHKAICESILPALAEGQRIDDLPRHWPGSRFDVVLRFDRDSRADRWKFRQLFPKLLSGDADVPI